MFVEFLYRLRHEGVPVATGEWLAFLGAVQRGIASDVDGFYRLGRAVLCRTEADYDAYDLAFAASFRDAVLDEAMRERLSEWLAEAIAKEGEGLVDPGMSDAELWEELAKRLAEQDERHDGGNHWVGTGGTSPFGHSGRASKGIRVGGAGGNRSAIHVAEDRQWESYRTDKALEIRDLQVVLKSLRRLQRQGRMELDLPGTIGETCRNAGEIELAWQRERQNQVRLVLLMDAGGSMAPHAAKVQQLFTAADELGTFKSFDAWFFHNCVYTWLWSDYDANERTPTAEVLASLTPHHRLVFVGDASMAPYELLSMSGWGFDEGDRAPGIEWLRRLRRRCPASVWLNPDPRTWWDHPTVHAIGEVFPMFELTVEGLDEAMGTLRAPT